MKTQLMIVIADGANARFHSVARDGAPTLFAELDHAAGRLRSGELVTDRPGQMRSDSSGRPQSLAQRETPATLERERFARRIADTIDDAFRVGHFTELALVMAPKLLGLVRAHLSSQARAAVVGEIPRRLSDRPVADVCRELDEVRRPAALT